jgi:hypothetical protein
MCQPLLARTRPRLMDSHRSAPVLAHETHSNKAKAAQKAARRVGLNSGNTSEEPTVTSNPGNVPARAEAPAIKTPGNMSSTGRAPPPAKLAGNSNSPAVPLPRLPPGNDVGAPSPITQVRSSGNVDPSISSLAENDKVRPPLGNDARTSSSVPTAARMPSPVATGAAFPGNVDPSDFLTQPEYDGVVLGVNRHSAGEPRRSAGANIVTLLNDKGLVPGNLPPEMGDIRNALEAINGHPISSLSVELIPGNIVPDGRGEGIKGGGKRVTVEFSPAGMPDNEPIDSLTMELVPGNVPQEIETMLGYLAQLEPRQIPTSAPAAARSGPGNVST